MPAWITISSGVLVLLTLLATAWKTVVRPLARLVSGAERAAPALELIAIDFPAGVAPSLKERLVALESGQEALLASSGRCEELLNHHVEEHHDG